MIDVRLLQTDEGQLLKHVRLAAIRDSPLGHTVALDEALTFDDDHWARRAAAGSTPERHVWVAFTSGRPVGIVGGQRTADSVEVDALWVDPGDRGGEENGHVADALLSQLQWWAHDLGLDLTLWVHQTNTRAITYYQRVGFTPTGASKPYPLPPGGLDVQMRASA